MTPAPTLPLSGGGSGEAAAGGEESAARALQEQRPSWQAETPAQHQAAAIAAGVAEVLAGVRAVLAEVGAMRAAKTAPRTVLDLQRLAQTYASLNATLRDLTSAQAKLAPRGDDAGDDQARNDDARNDRGHADDDIPADLDELRARLARRIAAFMESRPDDGDAGGPDGGRAGAA